MDRMWWLPGRNDQERVYECRACGTALDDRTTECPYCGPTDVVVFEVEG